MPGGLQNIEHKQLPCTLTVPSSVTRRDREGCIHLLIMGTLSSLIIATRLESHTLPSKSPAGMIRSHNSMTLYELPRAIKNMSVYWLGCETNCETDVPVDSDRHCPKMAVTLGFGWLLVLG